MKCKEHCWRLISEFISADVPDKYKCIHCGKIISTKKMRILIGTKEAE